MPSIIKDFIVIYKILFQGIIQRKVLPMMLLCMAGGTISGLGLVIFSLKGIQMLWGIVTVLYGWWIFLPWLVYWIDCRAREKFASRYIKS